METQKQLCKHYGLSQEKGRFCSMCSIDLERSRQYVESFFKK